MLTVVLEELNDEINVGQHHSSAAVSLEADIVESLSSLISRWAYPTSTGSSSLSP